MPRDRTAHDVLEGPSKKRYAGSASSPNHHVRGNKLQFSLIVVHEYHLSPYREHSYSHTETWKLVILVRAGPPIPPRDHCSHSPP
jgi:hypothetical protein